VTKFIKPDVPFRFPTARTISGGIDCTFSERPETGQQYSHWMITGGSSRTRASARSRFHGLRGGFCLVKAIW
jgi:hypothetical protein